MEEDRAAVSTQTTPFIAMVSGGHRENAEVHQRGECLRFPDA